MEIKDTFGKRAANSVNTTLVLLFSVVLMLTSCGNRVDTDAGNSINSIPVIEVTVPELKTEIQNYQEGVYTVYKVTGRMSNDDYDEVIKLIIDKSNVWNRDWDIGQVRVYYIGLDLANVTGLTRTSGGGCLYSLVLPTSVSVIEEDVWLGNVTITEDNPHFSYQDGILFSSDGTILYRYLPSKTNTSFVIPNTVQKVWGFAFAENINIRSITISENVKYIGMGTFENSYISELIFEDLENWITRDGKVLSRQELEDLQNYCWSNETLQMGICRNGIIKSETITP